MKKIQSLPAAAVLMLTALAPWNSMAQSTSPNESTAKIAPGNVTPPHEAASGTVSSQSADAMRPAAHDEASGKARKPPSSKKHRAAPVPAPKPVASSQSN
jgi:hypothetical protein